MPTRAAHPLAPYLALAGLWVLMLALVPPRANFPLNDDWIYAKIVQHLVETGEYQSNPYADPTFILQAYWGAAFVKVFGFSFDTLRLSTLVLGLAGVWAACWCAIEAGLSRAWAFLCGAVLLANPMYMSVSYAFMTDVPVLALSALAIAAFVRALRTGLLRWIWYANAIAVAAFFIRQFAMLVPIAFALAVLVRPANTFRARPVRALAALGVPWIAAAVLLRVLPIGGEGLGAGLWNWDDLGRTVPERATAMATFCAAALLYLTLFCAPILALARDSAEKRFPRKFAWRHLAAIAIAGVIGWLLIDAPYQRPPWIGNVLYDFGVGPLLLPWLQRDGLPDTPLRLGSAWTLINIVLALGAACVLVRVATILVGAVRDRANPANASLGIDLFLAFSASALIVVLILPAVANRFDRYFLGALVPAAVLTARAVTRGARFEPGRFAFVLPGVFYLFGVFCLQDYLSWNGARWKAAETLRAKYNAPLESINGGYEFNGWFHSDHFAQESRDTGKKAFGPKGWWTRGDEYRIVGAGKSGGITPGAVVRQPLAGEYTVLETQPYFTWLGFQRREILLLRAIDDTAPPDPAQ